MVTRRRLALAAPAGVLVAGAGMAAWVGLRRRPRSAIGGDFALVDGAGRAVTARDFRGRWMLIYFGYTHCPDACPTALQDMADAADLLGAKRQEVALLFITVDPSRDTPAVMRDYVGQFGSGFVGLTGSAEQVAAAARAYRVFYAKHPTADGYEMDHSSVIYVMDREGEFVTNFTHETSPQQIAAKLQALI